MAFLTAPMCLISYPQYQLAIVFSNLLLQGGRVPSLLLVSVDCSLWYPWCFAVCILLGVEPLAISAMHVDQNRGHLQLQSHLLLLGDEGSRMCVG